jgi:zinc D-Ala-D-Ala carboxypeptidase
MIYFQTDEFRCKCCGRVEMDRAFLELLDRARGLSEVPFRIRSGYRCPEHNRAVGGVEGSAHTRGLAADIETPDSHIRYQVLTGLWGVGFERLGIGRDYVHCDLDETKPQEVIWLY